MSYRQIGYVDARSHTSLSRCRQGCRQKTGEKTDREETHEKTAFELRASGADDCVAPAGRGAGGGSYLKRYLQRGWERQQSDLTAGQRWFADDQRRRGNGQCNYVYL